jgi:hypothetical protein
MHAPSTSAELRRHRRGTVGESQFLTADMVPQAGRPQRGIVLNISEGGLGLQLCQTPAVASFGEFRLELPYSGAPLAAKGAIAWAKPSGLTGVHFIDTSQETRRRIREWVDTQLERGAASHGAPLQFPVSPSLPGAETDDFRSALQLLVQRAVAATGASGAAIAVGDDSSMECFASSGAAPGIGAFLGPNAGLSGLCLRTGKLVRCADAFSDERVNAHVARQLNMRSAVILPAHVSGAMAGIFELFSPEPNAFSASEMMKQLDLFVQFLTTAIEAKRASHDLPAETITISTGSSRPTPAEPPVSAESPARPPETEAAPETRSAPELQTAPEVHVPEPVAIETTALSQKRPSRPARSFRRSAWLPAILSALMFSGLVVWYLTQRSTSQASSPQNAEQVQRVTSPKVSAAAPAQISFVPEAISEKVGSSFSVDVFLRDAQDVSAVPLQIRYDPAILQFVGIAGGDLLGQSGTLVHREDTEQGTIQLAASRPAAAPPMSGNGIVFTLIFLARTPGQSQLAINQAALRDPDMNLITTKSSAATVTVSERGQPAKLAQP